MSAQADRARAVDLCDFRARLHSEDIQTCVCMCVYVRHAGRSGAITAAVCGAAGGGCSPSISICFKAKGSGSAAVRDKMAPHVASAQIVVDRRATRNNAEA